MATTKIKMNPNTDDVVGSPNDFQDNNQAYNNVPHSENQSDSFLPSLSNDESSQTGPLHDPAVNDIPVSDITSNHFFKKNYLKSYRGNAIRKFIGLLILLANIALIGIIFVCFINSVYSGTIPILNFKLPAFFDSFVFSTNENGKTEATLYGNIVFYGSVVLIVLDIIFIFIMFSFGSMRAHVKKIENQE